MILAHHTIQGDKTPITICPLGDIQWNGVESEIAFKHLQEHIERCLTMPNPLFVGMGDYVDFTSPSNREALASARIYQGPRKAIGDKALQLADECYEKILKPTQGKWLGMLSGHHWYPLLSGGTTDTYLADKLKAPFLGVLGVVRVTFQGDKNTQHIQLWCHHGEGSGRTPAGPIAKLATAAASWDDVDVFLMGHMTKKSKADQTRVIPVFPSKGSKSMAYLVHKDVHLVGTGGWSKAFIEGAPEGTYVEQKLYNPVVLGAPLIHVRPIWRKPSNEEGGRNIRWDPRITVEV